LGRLFFVEKESKKMKKRLAKVLALGLTAAMVAGAPLSAMASEVNAADQAGETAVVAKCRFS
jgi:hypothetical protein